MESPGWRLAASAVLRNDDMWNGMWNAVMMSAMWSAVMWKWRPRIQPLGAVWSACEERRVERL